MSSGIDVPLRGARAVSTASVRWMCPFAVPMPSEQLAHDGCVPSLCPCRQRSQRTMDVRALGLAGLAGAAAGSSRTAVMAMTQPASALGPWGHAG